MTRQQQRFGERLRQLREAAGYSQEELAERASLSANAISALERGERKRPYPDTLRRLAEALGLGSDERAELVAAAAQARTAASTSPAAGTIPGREPERTAPDLPGEPTPLIGREREVEVVRHLLDQAEGRLLTLTGPGGVGKTRLALHVARAVADDYPDGVAWVELAPLAEAALVVPSIARALGLEETVGAEAREPLRAWLQGRRVLVVLDNVEHHLDAAPAVASLLQACPGLHLLATSRAPLSIRGEQEYVVPPLELPLARSSGHGDNRIASAVELFAWYARQKDPGFSITDANAEAIAAICRRLDGLPLALELAAARIRILSPEDLLDRLDRLMPLLIGGSRDLPQRQRTMRAAIDWSHDLLAPAEQALFRRLAVFAGGWTLDGAEAVGPADTDREVIDLLGALIEQSLVTVAHDELGTRYGMLEPIRQYALARLEEHGEVDDARRLHAGHMLALAERGATQIEGHADQVAWLKRIDREHDNLRAALAWSEAAPDGGETTLRLAIALRRFWEVQGHASEGGRWLARALERSPQASPVMRARALRAAGNLARRRTDLDAATRFHEASLAIYRELGDRQGIAFALNNLGVIARDRGEAARTIELCEESLALFRAVGDTHSAAIALISLGMAASQQGDYDRARARYDESLALFRAAGDSWHIASMQNYLARLLIRQGDTSEAERIATESLATYRETRDDWGVVLVLGTLGRAAQAAGDLRGAARQYGEALRLAMAAGIDRAIPVTLEDLASVAQDAGDTMQAARLTGAAAALRERVGVPRTGGDGSFTMQLTELETGPTADAWREGHGLTREQATAAALAVAGAVAEQPVGPTAA